MTEESIEALKAEAKSHADQATRFAERLGKMERAKMSGRIVEVDFHVGQTVKFRLDPDSVGLVTGIVVRDGSVAYQVTWENRCETGHYAFELTPSVVPSHAESE